MKTGPSQYRSFFVILLTFLKSKQNLYFLFVFFITTTGFNQSLFYGSITSSSSILSISSYCTCTLLFWVKRSDILVQLVCGLVRLFRVFSNVWVLILFLFFPLFFQLILLIVGLGLI